MSLGDLFLLMARWLHLVAAAAWVGGGLFYLLVLGPALRRSPEKPSAFLAALAGEFRALVATCIVVLVATGVVLAFDRLTQGAVEAPYAVTLAVKVALSAWMFLLARSQQRRSRVLNAYRETPRPPPTRVRRVVEAMTGYNALVVLGITIFFLSDLLKVLFEVALSRS